MYIHKYTHTYIYMRYPHIYVCVSIQISVCSNVHTYTRTCAHTYIHIYIHITYIHTASTSCCSILASSLSKCVRSRLSCHSLLVYVCVCSHLCVLCANMYVLRDFSLVCVRKCVYVCVCMPERAHVSYAFMYSA